MNIHLTPRSERLVREQLAQGEFRSPEEVIERALETLSEREQKQAELNLTEFEAHLDALAEECEKLPILPAEATSRAEIYQNHD